MEHLSVSQLNTFARCPVQWAFRYNDGLKCPPGIAARVGGGVHHGCEGGMEHKLEHGSDLAASEVQDIAVAGFDADLAEGEAAFTKKERGRGIQKVVGEARDRTAAMGHFWGVVVQPDYVPAIIEHRWAIPLKPLGIEFIGITDLVDADGIVVDWKTGSKSLPAKSAATSLQLTAYAMARHRETGRPPGGVRLEGIIEGKETRRQVLTSTRSEEDYAMLLRRIEVVHGAIQAGRFPPTSPDNWHCSPDWCGYYSRCKYVKG